jgi:hypothetical protein
MVLMEFRDQQEVQVHKVLQVLESRDQRELMEFRVQQVQMVHKVPLVHRELQVLEFRDQQVPQVLKV